MKFYIDLATRRFVRGPASSIPLERLFLKRRDKIDVEVIFVEKSAIVATPTGTSFSTGLKTNFSDTAFLALSDADGLLDLYTTALEALFADDPASVSAYLEVKTSRPGEETRTSTLGVDIENSVILGDEGSPAAEVSLKATSADATAGVSNEKWMTPLRVSEAIAALGGGSGGTAVNWTTLTGKPASFPPSSHTHPINEVTGLQTALNSKQAAGSYAASTHTHDASAITSGTLSIDRIPVLPSQAPVVVNGLLASIPSSQESSIVTGTVVITSDGKRYVYKGTGAKTSAESYIILADIAPSWASISDKPAAFAPTAHAHLVSEIAGLQGALDAKQPAGSYASAAQGAKADTASQPGHIHARADVTGLDSALATKITGSGVADMQVVTALPSSPSPTTFYIVIPSGATTASAVTLGSVSLFTGSGSGGGGGGGGGGDTTFSPTSLTSLALWLDATTGLYSATTGGSLVTTNGGAIARWEDRSTNARHFTQGTVNSRPVLSTASINGKNTISFDGTDDFLDSLYNRSYPAQSLFVVFSIFAAKSTSGLFSESESGASDIITYLPAMQRGSAIPLIASAANGSSDALSANNLILSTFAIGTFTHTGTQIINYLNGVAASAAVDTFPATNREVVRARLGARINSTGGIVQGTNLSGSIAEVIAYDRLLTTAERQQVETYLGTKWGIAL